MAKLKPHEISMLLAREKNALQHDGTSTLTAKQQRVLAKLRKQGLLPPPLSTLPSSRTEAAAVAAGARTERMAEGLMSSPTARKIMGGLGRVGTGMPMPRQTEEALGELSTVTPEEISQRQDRIAENRRMMYNVDEAYPVAAMLGDAAPDLVGPTRVLPAVGVGAAVGAVDPDQTAASGAIGGGVGALAGRMLTGPAGKLPVERAAKIELTPATRLDTLSEFNLPGADYVNKKTASILQDVEKNLAAFGPTSGMARGVHKRNRERLTELSVEHIANKLGVKPPRVKQWSPEVRAAFAAEASAKFEKLATLDPVPLDAELFSDFADWQRSTSLVGGKKKRNAITEIYRALQTRLESGRPLTAKDYVDLTKIVSAHGNASKSDAVAKGIFDLQRILDGWAARHVDELPAGIIEARDAFKWLKTIDPAIDKGTKAVDLNKLYTALDRRKLLDLKELQRNPLAAATVAIRNNESVTKLSQTSPSRAWATGAALLGAGGLAAGSAMDDDDVRNVALLGSLGLFGPAAYRSLLGSPGMLSDSIRPLTRIGAAGAGRAYIREDQSNGR